VGRGDADSVQEVVHFLARGFVGVGRGRHGEGAVNCVETAGAA
jgi:hypothetical protein